jgi:hypothetical protein
MVQKVARGFQQITSLSSAAALTIPTGADGLKPIRALIHCESQAVRWRDDGTAPTATVGMRLQVGQELDYDADLTKIQFIEEVASAKLNITYYRDS